MKNDVLRRIFQTLSNSDNPVQKELRHCVYFKSFFNLGHLCFLFPFPHFNVVTAAKSTGKSCILNIEKGEGEMDRIQCNFIENEEYIRDCS